MIDPTLERCATMLGRDRPDVQRYLQAAARSDDSARLARGRMLAILRQANIAPQDDDPFRIARGAYDVGGDGVLLGTIEGSSEGLIWRPDEARHSGLFVGEPGFGKTSAIINIVRQVAADHTVVIVDTRGDYECLLRVLPNARLFVFPEFPLNLLRGSSRVPPPVFNQCFSEIITDMMDARQASRRYLELVLDELEATRATTGHWPCMFDLLDALQDRKEPRGSDELRFRNRCLARIDSICRALGEKVLAVERGVDLESLIEEHNVLIFRANLERAISDVLTNWFLAYIFLHRLWSERKFDQNPLFFILDEQRNILRWRGAEEVTRFESQLTASRALGISCLIAEQIPTEICKAARVAPHLIMAFCPAGPELRATAELLGLGDRNQVAALQSLGKRECIVRLAGDRGLPPLRVWIPELDMDRSNLSTEERGFYMERSLTDQLQRVDPRYEGYVEGRQEVKQRERDPHRLSKNAYRVFTGIAGGPKTIDELCGDLNMNRAEEGIARNECMRKGYVAEAGNVGWGMKLFQLTPKGERFADEHNVPRRKQKSGVVHEFLLERVKQGLGAACPGLRWLKPAGVTGLLQPDAYGLFASGKAICVQISWKNKLEYEVDRLMELCSLTHVDMVLLVAPTKKKVLSLALLIGQRWKASIPQKYQLLSATDMLADGFDWTSILEREVDSGGGTP